MPPGVATALQLPRNRGDNKMYECAMSRRQQAGHTILEIIISISILLFMTFAVSSLMRSNIDMRFALAERSAVTHRSSLVMQRLVQDIQHSFIISSRDQIRNPGTRKNNGIFKIEVSSGGDQLTLTTMSKMPLVANNQEADTTLVVYKMEDDPESIGRRRLLRGEAKKIPDDLKEEIPMQVLATNMKSIKLMAWRGDDWSKDSWDTTRSEWRNRLPYMVTVEVEAFETDPLLVQNRESADEPTSLMRTVVFLPFATSFEEMRPQASTVRWKVW